MKVKTDGFVFAPGRTMVFEGATDDDFETVPSFEHILSFDSDRTHK